MNPTSHRTVPGPRNSERRATGSCALVVHLMHRELLGLAADRGQEPAIRAEGEGADHVGRDPDKPDLVSGRHPPHGDLAFGPREHAIGEKRRLVPQPAHRQPSAVRAEGQCLDGPVLRPVDRVQQGQSQVGSREQLQLAILATRDHVLAVGAIHHRIHHDRLARARRDEFRVRFRGSHERAVRVLPGPEPDRAITDPAGAGQDVVVEEGHAQHRSAVAGEDTNRSIIRIRGWFAPRNRGQRMVPGLDVPDADRLVSAARREVMPVGREGQAPDHLPVAEASPGRSIPGWPRILPEDEGQIARAGIVGSQQPIDQDVTPVPDRTVAGDRQQVVPILRVRDRRDRQCANRSPDPVDRRSEGAGEPRMAVLEFPDVDGLVIAARHQVSPVRAEHHRVRGSEEADRSVQDQPGPGEIGRQGNLLAARRPRGDEHDQGRLQPRKPSTFLAAATGPDAGRPPIRTTLIAEVVATHRCTSIREWSWVQARSGSPAHLGARSRIPESAEMVHSSVSSSIVSAMISLHNHQSWSVLSGATTTRRPFSDDRIRVVACGSGARKRCDRDIPQN